MATRSVPQPPFPDELLADLHADNVTPELSEQLWTLVRNDPEALRYMHALDEVHAQVRDLGRDEHVVHAMPDDIVDRLERFVENLEPTAQPTDQVAAIHQLPVADVESAVAPAHSMPGEPTDPLPTPVSLGDRRLRRMRWLAAAAAAVAVVACAAGVVSTLRDDDTTPTAQPTTHAVQLGNDLTDTTALSVLGRHDVTGALAGSTALNRCVRANGLDRAVLGSTNTTFRSTDAVLILLTGPRPQKITALVVGTGCTTGDPQQLAVQDIG